MIRRGRLRRLGCPRGWKLTRAIADGLEPRIEWHVSRCADCAAEYHELQALVVKTRAAFPVPDNKLSRDSRESIGARLRASVSSYRPRPGRRAAFWGVVPLVAFAVVLVLWGGRRPAPPRGGAVTTPAALAESRATIRAIGPTRFTRVQPQPDEIVRVDDGEIELEIAPLHGNERFRVMTEDAEVEVRGTSFKVSVSSHRLAAVHVWRGRVEVRSRGGVFAVLETGDDWVRAAAGGAPGPLGAPGVTAPASSGPARGVATGSPPPPARHSPAAKATKATTKPGGVQSAAREPSPPAASRDGRPLAGAASFGHAWWLLRHGDAKGAAAEFADVERLARGRDIEEDALYWRAVAVGRTGDSADARRLFGEFLDRFPASSRAREASAALGWLLLEAGEPRAARRAFERAARDPSPRVQADAEEGLERTQEEDR